MPKKDLDKRFNEAFEVASNLSPLDVPQDVQLRLYAFYKQATIGNAMFSSSNTQDLRNAFKLNAWMQINHYNTEEAKEAYIDIVNSLIDKDKMI